MNRLALASLLFTLTLSTAAMAESYTGWTKGGMLKQRAYLCDALEKEVHERAARLGKETGQPFTVQFQFPHGDEKAKQKFAASWIAKKFKEEDVDGRWADLVQISGDLSKKEAEARPAWLEKMKDALASERPKKEGTIYGTRVNARKLGAILDNSPSMEKYLPALRKEIAHAFEDYPSVEIYGSWFNRFTHSRLRIPSRTDPDGRTWYAGGGSSDVWFDTRWYAMAPGEASDPFDPAWHFPLNFPAVPKDQMHIYSILTERDNVSAILGMVEHP